MILQPQHLRCEYLINPLGLDIKQPRLSWKIIALKDDGITAEDEIPRGVTQNAYRIVVASTSAGLNAGSFDIWDSGFVTSDQSAQVVYKGKPLSSHSFYFWKVQVKLNTTSSDKPKLTVKDSDMNFWQIGLLDEKEIVGKWIGTIEPERKWIEVLDVSKEKETYCKIKKSVPSPYLRKSIEIKKRVKNAVVYASAMGDYELFFNGNRVSKQQLAPEWTIYSKRVQYQTHDITNVLKQGSNVIGSVLGDGWCVGNIGPGDKIWQLHYATQRYFLLQLRILYDDGSIETISSDGSWKYWADGPIQAADNFLGCEYDCSKQIEGWNTSSFDDSKWESVIVNDSMKPHLVAQKNEPVEIFHEFSSLSINECKPNMYIVNFGQNLVGWCRLRLKGNHSGQVTLRHGEMLDDDGTLYTHNLRLAPQIDTYKITDNEEHKLEPHFTFHGFQYIEITGLTKKPSAEDIQACAISSTSPLVGSFECSDPMLNKLWSNILWTQRDNMVSIPTDCPQRNERMGWMGDCLAFAQTGIYNTDLAAFFSKFCQDIRDEQTADGRYTDFIPHPQDESKFTDAPGWADNGIELPWRLYINYGDIRILEEHYESAKRYVDYIRQHNPDNLWKHWRGNYGDWLNGDTLKAKGYPKKGAALPKEVYATMFFASSSRIVSKMAKLIDKEQDYEFYGKLSDDIRAAFNKTYVSKKGKIKGDTQAGYAFALNIDILPEEMREKAVENLMKAIKKYNGRISTGFMTTQRLMLELSRYGKNDVAYKLATTHQFPSWGYSIDQGATTI